MPNERAATGVAGLDDVLGGGLPPDRLYLVQGTPGVGKTTLGLQFLLEGARRGESVLYITLSETEAEIRQIAASHGWTLDAIQLFELSSAEQTLRLDDENTLYATADVDLKETVRVLLDEVARTKPTRVVFDSLSEIRLLSQTPMRYRRQLLALKQHFAGQHCTVLLLDDRSGGGESDVQVESLAHGVIVLEQSAMDYGADRRRLRVAKLRGIPFRSGHHDFVIQRVGSSCFRGWSRRNIAAISPRRRCRAAYGSSINCSAAGSTARPRRWSWARRARARARSPLSSPWPLPSAAR
jgi:circadian clock protein KaiC